MCEFSDSYLASVLFWRSVFVIHNSDLKSLYFLVINGSVNYYTIYQETKNNKVLIFPNTRGRVEEISVKLKRISEKQNGHHNYFSHHSSVDKEVREYVEYFAKNNKRDGFCISCTSTLELGIQI